MKIIKEKIIELKNDEFIASDYIGTGVKHQLAVNVLGDALNIIDSELQDFTFLRVPKREKLSNIIKRLNNPLVEYDKMYDTLYIKNRYSDSETHRLVLAKIIENKLEKPSKMK